jgi:hypothetical protein
VNKADRDGADRTVQEILQMLEMGEHGAWIPPVLKTVARTGKASPACRAREPRRAPRPASLPGVARGPSEDRGDRAERLSLSHPRRRADRHRRAIEAERDLPGRAGALRRRGRTARRLRRSERNDILHSAPLSRPPMAVAPFWTSDRREHRGGPREGRHLFPPGRRAPLAPEPTKNDERSRFRRGALASTTLPRAADAAAMSQPARGEVVNETDPGGLISSRLSTMPMGRPPELTKRGW